MAVRRLPTLAFLISIACALQWQSAASAAERVALVVGNSKYRHAPPLGNPLHDAADLASSLERLGFAVSRMENAPFDEMRLALRNFGYKAREAQIAVVFFAGHGIEVGGENWLIPVDAELNSDIDAEHEAVGLKSVMLSVSGATKLGLVILDACRNNPFAAKMRRTVRVRSVDRGLARVEPLGSTLVAYASRDGTTARDGSGRNSPFTSALVKHLETPGLEINFLFRRVRDDVLLETQREQEPYVYGSLSKEPIFLKAASLSNSQDLPASVTLPSVHRLPEPSVAPAAAPRLPLPAEISVDPAILQLVETHPFFENAARVSANRYNVVSNSRSTINGFNVITDSNDDTRLRWLRAGIAQFDTTQSMRQKNSGSTSSVIRSTYLGAANGFVSLGYRSTSTMHVTTQRKPLVYTSAERLTSLANLKGRIFPIEVGGRFSYQAVYQTTSSSMPGDEKTLDESCEVTKRYEAKSFNSQLTGAAFLVTCDQRIVYRKTKTSNSNSQSKTVYFDALGICVRADSIAPTERTVQTYFDGNASEANILKSFVANSSP